MNSLERVGKLLREHLEEATTHGPEIPHYLLIIAKAGYNQRVYDCFFNWITDPTKSPESIIHLLDTYIRGIDGFSTNTSIQTLVSFSCLEALARRRPAILGGQWEKIAWIIVKYSTCSNTILEKGLTNFRTINETTLKWIVEFSTHELCPNPCLRLELFRLMRSFNRAVIKYDRVSFRDKVIKTIFELFENFSSLTVDQLPIFSPMDLQFIIRDNNISIGDILNECDLYPERFNLIIVMLWLTRNLALIEKVRWLKVNSQVIVPEVWKFSLEVQLSCCLAFCGLITPRTLIYPGDDDMETEYNTYLHYFVQTIGNASSLLNIVIQTLETITDVSLCFPDDQALHNSVTDEKDKLLHRFFKDQISYFPTHKYLQEIHGGFNPTAENRLRYFQNSANTMAEYNDSETDSECYYNGNENQWYVSEENYSD